jgi:hypothetical protein
MYYMHMKKTRNNVVLQIEPNSTYRKCKESAHMVLAVHLISPTSLDIFLTRTPVIAAEVSILQLLPV